MKLSISNIIWSKGKKPLNGFLDAAAECDLAGVELALNAIYEEPVSLADADLITLRQEIAKRGLAVSALHSLTFTRNDLELFGCKENRKELLNYILEYVRIARLLNCKNLVFGSPSAREMHGRTREECDNIFLDFLAELDKHLENIFFNIEPLHPSMCEYLHTLQDAKKLIMDGNLHHVKVQLDLRSCIENCESTDQIRSSLPYVTHCQVSDPGLSTLAVTHSQKHELFASILRDAHYTGFVAGEMLPPNGLTNERALQAAANSLKAFYG